MQRALIVTGVLGLGTVLVFGAAALTAMLFPNGTLVAGGWNGSVFVERTWSGPAPPPIAVPGAGGVSVDLPAVAPEPS